MAKARTPLSFQEAASVAAPPLSASMPWLGQGCRDCCWDGGAFSLVEGFNAPAIDVVARTAVGSVRAGAAGKGVVARAANHQVVAIVAVDRVVALAADEDVVVTPAVERQCLDASVRQSGGADDVVAAAGVD